VLRLYDTFFIRSEKFDFKFMKVRLWVYGIDMKQIGIKQRDFCVVFSKTFSRNPFSSFEDKIF